MRFQNIPLRKNGVSEEVDFGGLKVTFSTDLEGPVSDFESLSYCRLERFEEAIYFWNFSAGGRILADVTFGQSGLVLHSPNEAIEATSRRKAAGYEIDTNLDLVIGEFLGDSDMLLITNSGRAVCSIGSTPRSEWKSFDNLEQFFEQYLEADGDKPWG